MSDELWKVVLTVLGAMFGSALLQLGAGYIARLRAPSQNMKDEAEANKSVTDAALSTIKATEQIRVLYEDQFKDQQADIEQLKEANRNFEYRQLQNQRRILELESQDRFKSERLSLLENQNSEKTTEIASLKSELAALYDYIGLIEKWARENKLSLPNKSRRTDGPEAREKHT